LSGLSKLIVRGRVDTDSGKSCKKVRRRGLYGGRYRANPRLLKEPQVATSPSAARAAAILFLPVFATSGVTSILARLRLEADGRFACNRLTTNPIVSPVIQCQDPSPRRIPPNAKLYVDRRRASVFFVARERQGWGSRAVVEEASSAGDAFLSPWVRREKPGRAARPPGIEAARRAPKGPDRLRRHALACHLAARSDCLAITGR